MIKVLTAAQMREVDRLTTERYGIPSILLMENAAHAVARVITEKLGGSVKGKSILILCGPGNNGGDGAALGRILAVDAGSVYVVLVGQRERTKGDARVQFDALDLMERDGATNGLDVWQIGSYEEFLQTFEHINVDMIVDALFGTGLQQELAGPYDEILGCINERSVNVVPWVAIDLPSGLDADRPERIGFVQPANITVTFTAPKAATVLPPTNEYCGDLRIANIGSPSILIDQQPSQLYLAESRDAKLWIERSEFTNASYKNKRGHALIIGGSRDYSGAAVLAGNAGIRSGVGLVTLAVPEDSRDGVIGRVSPEVMVRGLSQTPDGSAAEKAADEVSEFLKNVDVVAIGSGLSSKEDETKAFIRRMVEERQTPVIIDADGLTALSPWATNGPAEPQLQKPAREQGLNSNEQQTKATALILTPHEGEFAKLLGLGKEETTEKLKDRVQAVREFATTHNVILVLKGERNLIGHPDGRVVVNPTGNSGLGKAGNGDTLTGIIAGFVAQAVQMNIGIFETVVAAVYVAGLAGDIAKQKYGKRVMTASDVRDCLVEVFESLGDK